MKTRLTAALAAALVVAAAASPAAAQERGSAVLTLDRSALADHGVRAAAARPATLRGARVTLPVSRGVLGARSGSLEHGGGLVLRRGARRVGIAELRTVASGSRATLTARVRGRRLTLATLSGPRARVDRGAGTLALPAARVTLTRRAAATLRRALGLRRLPRRIGTLRVAAALRGRTTAAGESESGSGGGGGGATPGAPGSSSGGGPAPGQTPTNQPMGDEPPVLARPASAVPVTATTITWHPRESWIRYLATSALAPSHGTTARDGATEGETTMGDDGRSAPLVYDFFYTGLPDRSWHDPASGASALYFRGTVNFRHVEHGIDLDAKDAEIELNGSASRAIFRFAGREGTPADNKRAVLLELDLAAVTPTRSGTTTTWSRIPARVARGAESTVFGGMYAPGSPWGWVTVSHTT